MEDVHLLAYNDQNVGCIPLLVVPPYGIVAKKERKINGAQEMCVNAVRYTPVCKAIAKGHPTPFRARLSIDDPTKFLSFSHDLTLACFEKKIEMEEKNNPFAL